MAEPPEPPVPGPRQTPTERHNVKYTVFTRDSKKATFLRKVQEPIITGNDFYFLGKHHGETVAVFPRGMVVAILLGWDSK